jgi:hypothetical protein
MVFLIATHYQIVVNLQPTKTKVNIMVINTTSVQLDNYSFSKDLKGYLDRCLVVLMARCL